jgi:hypothetical protein
VLLPHLFEDGVMSKHVPYETRKRLRKEGIDPGPLRHLPPRRNPDRTSMTLPYGFGYGDEQSGELIEDEFGSFDPGIPGTTVTPRDVERGWKEYSGGGGYGGERGSTVSLNEALQLAHESALDPLELMLAEEEEAEEAAMLEVDAELRERAPTFSLTDELTDRDLEIARAGLEVVLQDLGFAECPVCGAHFVVNGHLVSNVGFVPPEETTFWVGRNELGGQPRRHCSNACKQKDYRNRRRVTEPTRNRPWR